ncbi:MAG TPA: hypothetical protein ENF30_02510 [Candidatus Desulfofervidus auxilii]|uniref:OmpA-like domain-containing protein n=1 Tax=Desulfofervidus auxilii TaxID=1621989 RepID=A0A7V0IAE6_DESA2|nr:hypothetical protein [Candidatus Desulfofervidus auxilii]
MGRRKKETKEAKRPNTFIISYASLSTIILAFFICMSSMATIVEEKVVRGFYSIRSSFGVGGGDVAPLEEFKGALNEYTLTGIEHEAILQLQTFLQKHPFSENIHLGITKRGLIVSLGADLLFSPGSADLRPHTYPILERVAMLISSCDNPVRIEGYTDNTPIHTPRFPSNWELSGARAIAVLKFFLDEGIPAKRMVAVGYGETNPLFPNDTPEHKAKNRRVWIILEGKPQRIKKSKAINIRGFIFEVK